MGFTTGTPSCSTNLSPFYLLPPLPLPLPPSLPPSLLPSLPLSAYAEYFLMDASEAYAPIMATVHEKIYLSKVCDVMITSSQ